ncbi:MAG: glyoxalase superfamily protein, partial [Bacteroidota bacterium]
MSLKIIPVLRIFDYAKMKEFYLDWLGFTIDWEHTFGENSPVYLQISREHI